MARASAAQPEVWMVPPSCDNGRWFRELFEKPHQWKEMRSLVEVLFCADHNLRRQFTDEELRRWFGLLNEWKLKFGMEVGAIKPCGQTGEACFSAEKPNWDRLQKLGADLCAIPMDEPLLCCRQQIKKPDDYAVQETANCIALVRRYLPHIKIGDIETYPSRFQCGQYPTAVPEGRRQDEPQPFPSQLRRYLCDRCNPLRIGLRHPAGPVDD